MRLDEAIAQVVSKGTMKWAAIKRQQERDWKAAERSERRWESGYSDRIYATDIVNDAIPPAYLKASGGGQYPANARQVMYAARPAIQEATGRPLDDKYFTQTLLPDYMQNNPEKTARWDVVYDARGHLLEPHTDLEIGLGTLGVRKYLQDCAGDVDLGVSLPELSSTFPTSGWRNRYGAILYIEKEGFLPLLRQARFPERYDLAVMSSKGMGTTALRTLVEAVHQDVKVLVLHDFDVAGFSIAGTLTRDTRRYKLSADVHVIELGLRLGDIKGLETEQVVMKGDPRNRLEMNGATEAEIEFLRGTCQGWNRYEGRRVELNAFTSDQFVAWLDSKLKKHKIGKVIPDKATLEQAYRRAAKIEKYRAALRDAESKIEDEGESLEVPKDLKKRLAKELTRNRSMAWDDALEPLVAKA